MPAMSKRVLERYRVRRLTEAESKACKVDRVRSRRMVNLAAEMERWRELKRQKNLPSDAAVAKLLLDAYMSIERQQHVSLRGSSSEGAGEIAAAEPVSHSAEHIEEDKLGAVCLGEDPARPPELGAVCLGEEMEKHTGPPAGSTEQKLCQSLTTGDKRRPYPCSLCEKSFWAPGKLKIHHRVHSGETPYLCAVCGKSFSQAGTLKRHERVHTGETPHHCPECGKGFKYGGDLNRHKRTHTGEKPNLCPECGRGFSEAGSLKAHRRIHSGEKPYQCKVCAKHFRFLINLHTHQRRHTCRPPRIR